MISSARYPLILSAPRFQVRMFPSGSNMKMAYSCTPSTSNLKSSPPSTFSLFSISFTGSAVVAQEFCVNRQATKTHSGCGKNCVGYGRGQRRNAGLAHALGGLIAGNNVDLNLRGTADSKHLVVMEIALLDSAVFDGDLARQHRSEGIVNGPFRHGAHAVRVHHCATIDGAHDAVHMHRSILVHRNFGDVGDVTAKGKMASDASAMARRQWFAPAGFLGRKFQHRAEL